MDRLAGPGGGPGARSAEDVFRGNVRETTVNWLRRLQTNAGEAAAVRAEAGELRAIAQARGWGELAGHLQRIEQTPLGLVDSLIRAVGVLERILAFPAAQANAPAARGTVRMDPAQARAAFSPPPAARPPDMSGSLGPGSIPLPPLLDGPPPALPAPPMPSVPPVAEGGRRPPPRSPAPPRPLAPPHPRDPEPGPKSLAPKLLVKSMLGFRAFKEKAPPAGAGGGWAGPPPAPASPLLGLGELSSKPSQGSEPLPRAPVDSFADRAARQTPARPLPGGADSKSRRISSATPVPRRAPRRPQSGPPRWFFFVVGGGALLIAAVVAVVVVARAPAKVPLDVDAAPVGQPSGAIDAIAPAAETASNQAGLPAPPPASGKESRELKTLLDEQQRLLQACLADATKCGRWTRFSKETLTAPANPVSAPPSAPEGPRDGWLQRLKIPKDFPQDTDSRLKEIFDYDARRPTGRTGFNVRYFECSAYEDIIDAALLKYEAPSWLKAVVFQESGCILTATSPVGAKGLWQFMPESARAYGLRVSEGEIDQRLDPVRSTDAGIRFLTDLRNDVGAWDLALAAYNMGPYGVIRRLQQMGGKATFRDLAQADLLPQETSLYVPNIEAYALVLENMRSLHLGGSGKHPETTSEITVKSGTRLSLIARAAHTSTIHIKELNRAYLGEVVPEGETTAWVPDAEAHRAQLFFDTPGPDDRVDTCVPEDFDWGTTVLETSKYAQQCAPKP